jgi:hypothetical protein
VKFILKLLQPHARSFSTWRIIILIVLRAAEDLCTVDSSFHSCHDDLSSDETCNNALVCIDDSTKNAHSSFRSSSMFCAENTSTSSCVRFIVYVNNLSIDSMDRPSRDASRAKDAILASQNSSEGILSRHRPHSVNSFEEPQGVDAMIPAAALLRKSYSKEWHRLTRCPLSTTCVNLARNIRVRCRRACRYLQRFDRT